MKRTITKTHLAGFLTAVMLLVPASALAATPAANTETNPQRLTNLKTRGDGEITRRLTSLSKLTAAISSAQKLSQANKVILSGDVTNEIAALNTLKTKLDGDTDLATARTDVQSIVSNYRVYALIVPKVRLIVTADRELANDDKLIAVATKLQTRITADKTAGKDVTALQASLDDMNAKIAAAVAIATAVNAKVSPLQPTDYNTDHTILDGQRDQLKTAHQDNLTAYQDAKTIVKGL